MYSTSRLVHRSTCASVARCALVAGTSLWLLWTQVGGAAPSAPPASPPAAAPVPAPGGAAPSTPTPAPTAEQAITPEAASGQFALALEAVRRGDLVETARLCWSYLQARKSGQVQNEAGGADKSESATYYLGEALERLGYIQAAIDRYTEIVSERRAPQLVPRALSALERLSRKSRPLEEAIAREGVLSVSEFEELPPRLASFVHYRQAVDDLRRGYDTWAMRHLDYIRADTPYQPLSLYARAVHRLARGESDAALSDLDKVLAHKETPPDLRARALHSRARLRYDRGLWNEAYGDLDQVDVRFETGGEILMEKAWAKFRAKDFRTSLGLLHALGAPSYASRFNPERYLLRSLIFSKFCHFRAAKRSIEMFRERFQKELASLKEGTLPEEVSPLREAAYERTAVTGAGAVHAVLSQMEVELEAVGRHATWGDPKKTGSLNHFLAQLYGTKLRGSRFRERQLLHSAAELVASELLNANEQMNLLEYEVGLGIYRRVGRDARVGIEGEKRLKIPKVSEPIYLHFDGEYWSDELPDMQFFIEDRCVD